MWAKIYTHEWKCLNDHNYAVHERKMCFVCKHLVVTIEGKVKSITLSTDEQMLSDIR